MLPALIMVTTIATSSTGGNYAGPGGVVETGSQSASSYVETRVGASGTTSVDVRTEANGAASSTTTVLPPSTATTQIEVRTSAHNGAAQTSVRIKPRISAHATTTQSVGTTTAASSTASASSTDFLVVPTPASMVPPPLGIVIVRAIVSFFKTIFGI